MTTQEHAGTRSTPHPLTYSEVADRLRMSRRWVEDLVKRGRLEAIRLGPKAVRVRADDFDRYITSRPSVRRMAGVA